MRFDLASTKIPRSLVYNVGMADLNLRLATPTDLSAINEIYNHFVLRSTCTYQTEPETVEARAAWFARHGELHPVTVAERAGTIVGWGSLSPFHARAAYGHTVENSVYVHPTSHRQGIGRALLADLIERARRSGHHTIIAIIDAEQGASVALHAALGFARVGRLRELGHKFGRWLDVDYMQLILGEGR
jgi:phosphinothricin acetyltransferase